MLCTHTVHWGCYVHTYSGPPIAEMNSIWFKLWLYHKLSSGPPSLLLAKGFRLRKLPVFLKVRFAKLWDHVWVDYVFVSQGYSRLLVTTWGHDPTVVFISNILLTINDALTHSAVLVQVSVGVVGVMGSRLIIVGCPGPWLEGRWRNTTHYIPIGPRF